LKHSRCNRPRASRYWYNPFFTLSEELSVVTDPGHDPKGHNGHFNFEMTPNEPGSVSSVWSYQSCSVEITHKLHVAMYINYAETVSKLGHRNSCCIESHNSAKILSILPGI
jgi:hypothetical protein